MDTEVVDTTQKIATQLRVAIAKKNTAPTNQEIAEKANISAMAVGRYLKGERAIPMPAYVAICAALEVDPVEIMRLALNQ